MQIWPPPCSHNGQGNESFVTGNAMKSAILASVLCCLLALSGCGGGGAQNTVPPPPPALSSIQITGQSVNLIAGQSEQLKAIGTYSGGTTQDLTSSTTWSSSDASVATVTSAGMLSAKASGSCSITAKTGSVSGSFRPHVAPPLVSIAVTPPPTSHAPCPPQQIIAPGPYTDN